MLSSSTNPALNPSTGFFLSSASQAGASVSSSDRTRIVPRASRTRRDPRWRRPPRWRRRDGRERGLRWSWRESWRAENELAAIDAGARRIRESGAAGEDKSRGRAPRGFDAPVMGATRGAYLHSAEGSSCKDWTWLQVEVECEAGEGPADFRGGKDWHASRRARAFARRGTRKTTRRSCRRTLADPKNAS